MNQMPTRSSATTVEKAGFDGRGCLAVIATYNEIENLPVLVKQLHHRHPAMQLLIIDDGSPDGTGHWCDQFAQDHADWFQVIHRAGKQGLGSATVCGFQRALERNVERVLTMDADFSHDPLQVDDLLQASLALPEPAVVIGSRYVSGGKIEGWPMSRRIASRCINAFARFWLRLKTRDNSGAFRCYDRTVLEQLDLDDITNQGYGYLEEILFLARRQGVRFHEVAITFRDRVAGESKINAREAFTAVMTLLRLGWNARLGTKSARQRTP